MHLKSLIEAREYLDGLRRKQETLGTIHTLGALHEGHAALIRQSAIENKNTIVSIYPNKIQLLSGSKYQYDLQKDTEFALGNGATAVISSTDDEMFSDGFSTYIDQGECYSRLAGSILPNVIKGMITGCIRWINFTQPTRSYFGLKDIEQSVLVKKAVKDLLIHCEIRHVPCVRFKSGVPISSRLANLNADLLSDVSLLYNVISQARNIIYKGERDAKSVIAYVDLELRKNLKHFSVIYTKIVDAGDFRDIDVISIPFVIQSSIRFEKVTHFDGQLIYSEEDLRDGNPVIWLE